MAVITADETDWFKTRYAIGKKLVGRTIPIDIIVNSKTDFENQSNEITLQKMIRDEGILIYDRQ